MPRSGVDAMLDKHLFVLSRPGDADPALRVENRYGDYVDEPIPGAAADEQAVHGAYQFNPAGSGEPDPSGRNAGIAVYDLFVEPSAAISRTDVIVERADPADPASAEVNRFQIRVADLVTDFDGNPSHWEIRAEVLS